MGLFKTQGSPADEASGGKCTLDLGGIFRRECESKESVVEKGEAVLLKDDVQKVRLFCLSVIFLAIGIWPKEFDILSSFLCVDAFSLSLFRITWIPY
jgi:hypothetical protein